MKWFKHHLSGIVHAHQSGNQISICGRLFRATSSDEQRCGPGGADEQEVKQVTFDERGVVENPEDLSFHIYCESCKQLNDEL